MNTKRRDNKNRLLQNGESQRSDGRYMYKYVDLRGETKYVYSWRLVMSDATPKGKKDDIPLREKEKLIKKELELGIHSKDGEITVLDLVEKYCAQKTGVRQSTLAGYGTVINILKKDNFGYRKIKDIKMSDARTWLIYLQAHGRSYSSIHTIRGVLRPAFQMAVDDDVLVKNPFNFQLNTVIVNDSVTREAITKKQERLFLKFIHDDNHFKRYYEGMYILFRTGLRISEFVGLTINDIDFEKKCINVSRQLIRTSKMQYMIEKPKTESGNRCVPMTDEVCECFKRIIKNRKAPKKEVEVDGISGFLYYDKTGKPMIALHWEKYFHYACEKYNKIYKEPMPKITPHVCRHTFCSNMAKSGMYPKMLQRIMGHSDIGVTMDTYTHMDFDDLKNELESVYKKDENEKL